MLESKAIGRADASYLFVMLSRPSEAMLGWFWRKLHLVGIKKVDVRIVFMINGDPANAGNKASKAQLRDAATRFELEMKRSSPRVACPMGTDAFYALTGINESILDARGYLIRRDLFHPVPRDVWKQVGTYANASKATGAKKGDAKMKWVREAQDGLLGAGFEGVVIPLFTLDYIAGSQFNVTPAFVEDVARAKRAADGTLAELVMGEPITTLDALPRLDEWGDLIAIDIETHGIDNEVIDLVSFSNGEMTAVLEWTEGARAYVELLLDYDPNMIVAVHNSPFDLPRLSSNGVHITDDLLSKRVFDTMFGAVVLQPDLHKGLGRVAPVYLDLAPWKTGAKKDTSHWRLLVNADPIRYAGKDAFYTAWIARQQIAAMKDLGVWKLFMGVDGHPGPGVMATIPELATLTSGGLRLDKENVITFCDRLERQMFQYLKLWTRMFPAVKFSSNPQLMKLLYTEWGLPVYRTKEDGVTVDERTLVLLRAYVEQHKENPQEAGPWQDDPRCCPRTFDLMLKMRTTSKLLGTYVQPLMLSGESWVHPSYLPASKDDERGGKKMDSKGTTATGRLSSYKPNIQNQMKSCSHHCKGSCEHFKVKNLYVPDTDEQCFVQADYKSAELFSLEGMSGDKLLGNDLRSGDMHGRNAERIGVPRPTTKNVTYASQYLASPGKMSEMILEQEHMWVSPAECQMISNAIWSIYTDASAYKQLLVEMCETKGYVQNAFGRIRFFHSGRAPSAVDFIPQSTVADILWCVLKDVAVFLRSIGGRMVTTVHDSILASVPADRVDEAARGMKRIMERRFDCVRKGWYIPVEVESGAPGASWAELRPYAMHIL